MSIKLLSHIMYSAVSCVVLARILSLKRSVLLGRSVSLARSLICSRNPLTLIHSSAISAQRLNLKHFSFHTAGAVEYPEAKSNGSACEIWNTQFEYIDSIHITMGVIL